MSTLRAEIQTEWEKERKKKTAHQYGLAEKKKTNRTLNKARLISLVSGDNHNIRAKKGDRETQGPYRSYLFAPQRRIFLFGITE